MLRLPIGYDNFRKIIDNKFDFVDKSLLVKELIDDTAEAIVITRPRRFGKTFNMSMLQHFFGNSVEGKETTGLFDDLKIAAFPKYMEHQGQYPVISLSFKDIKDGEFTLAYEKVYELLIEVYSKHLEVIESEKLGEREKELCRLLLARKASRAQVENALKTLTTCMSQHYGVKTILLIDEYDAPIQASYIGGYYDQMMPFMRSLLGTTLKGNPDLHKGILTGILRVSKESLFSGLNNIKVYSLLNTVYSEYFGFTEAETERLLDKANLKQLSNEIKNWYNGYKIGNAIIYNPWSIVNCIVEKGKLMPYWINTSDNALVKNLIIESSQHFKSQLELLLQENNIERIIDENIVFEDLKTNESAIWSLFLMTGYLKVSACVQTNRGWNCKLEIPNQEVRNLYQVIIEEWLSHGYGTEWYKQFLEDLLTGNMIPFERALQKILLQIVGTHDLTHEPEVFYHGLMLGLVASLDKSKYLIKSNRESGFGRFDISIFPKNTNNLGIILELKSVKLPKSSNKEALDALLFEGAKKALQQINEQHYMSEFEQQNIKSILKIGLAFSGKQFRIEYENYN